VILFEQPGIREAIYRGIFAFLMAHVVLNPKNGKFIYTGKQKSINVHLQSAGGMSSVCE